jgi:hypothetical protein
VILVRTKDGVRELGEKLNADLAKWKPAQKSEVAEQLRACFGVSKEQLRAIRPYNERSH